MKKNPVFTAILLFLAVSVYLSGQEGSFVPIVSQIRAEVRNNLVRLTWEDSPDAQGYVFIFRSTRDFSGSVPANIRPVVVSYGVQSYIDDSDGLDSLFYFIAASDTQGRRYDVIIPHINSTSVNFSGVFIGQVPPPTAPEMEPVQGISNLRARQDGERVVITFTVTGPRKNAVLYRSMQPVRQPQDLLDAVIVQSGLESPFVDNPVPGLFWYYALIFEDEIFDGNMGIMPGINATTSSVIVSGDRTTERPIRPIPLPAMALGNTISDGFFLSEVIRQVPLDEETLNMLRDTGLPPKASLVLRNPRIFTVDLQAPSGGEDSALFQIISEFFVKRDWEGAHTSLLRYLSLPRSKDIEARARFYLGQTLYFTGDYNGALFEFLMIKTLHPVEANIWIDATLSAMVH